MSAKKDYWFSTKAKVNGLRMARAHPELAQHTCHFKGKEFTEQVDHGTKPITAHYDDNVLLGTGDDNDCTYTPIPTGS